ncbi:MAG: hypothetical protein K9I99_11960 [Melioribacteraceae bacterium]|nr:hypothetical protein [Melioribacteraceae bacterium]
MDRKFLNILIAILILTGAQFTNAQDTHGDVIYRAKNIHAGNLIRVTFHNNARMGSVSGDQSATYNGEWPIGTGFSQLGNSSPYVMTELRVFSEVDPLTGDSLYEFITPVVFCEGWDPNIFSNDSLGRFQGFEPLPGYLNLSQKEKDPGKAVAVSHQAFTWPASWPDKVDDPNDPGWAGSWNGYFGKDQLNADEESYFVLDDYQFDKRVNGFKLPQAFEDDPNRTGLGLRLGVRGLQWSNPDAEDCIFWLYEIKNYGDLYLDHTLFGTNVGASSGSLLNASGGNEWADDAAKFYREISLAVNYDVDNTGVRGYTPVPWLGFAFLESPGNATDGIDNDGDGFNTEVLGGGTGKIIDEQSDFYKFYDVGDDIVLIDYNSERFDRTLSTMPSGGIDLEVGGRAYSMRPNSPLEELPRNGVDDNLNGLIDESDGAFTQDSLEYFLYLRSEFNDQDYLAVNYLTGDGADNPLIDERRDDQIDNDGDWDSQFDDVGLDGKPGTGDQGEGDGVPTPGYGDLPGEPSIDQVDVDESDQIGLTSFKFYRYSTLTYSNDDQMWDFSRPGYFDNSTVEVADHDYVFSSGYFPLRPDQEEFFSIALIYGWNEVDILRNKEVVQRIYNSNYNFAIAPNKPQVKVVAGDGQVTIYWDDEAEFSYDRFLRKYDFEGYKIYRSTHHTFADAGSITDGLGFDRFKVPLAIYDKVDSVFGYFPEDFGTGVLFNLGNETGLVHSYVDNDVTNGIKYYYAVTAYDQGDLEKNIGPSESTIFVNVDQSGNIEFSENVVIAIPQAPSLGYKGVSFDVEPTLVGEGKTTGQVGINIINPDILNDGDEFEIQFIDQSVDKRDNDLDSLIDAKDSDELLPIVTTGMILRNLTQGIEYDSLWLQEYVQEDSSYKMIQNLYDDNDGDPHTFSTLIDGFEFFVYNPPAGVYNDPTNGIYSGIESSIDYTNNYNLRFGKFQLGGFRDGTPYPRQFKIVFHNEIVDTSAKIGVALNNGNLIALPPRESNFKIYDAQTGLEVDYGFSDVSVDRNLTPTGFFSAKDRIFFYETLPDSSTIITFSLVNNDVQDTVFFNQNDRIMGEGDTLKLYPDMPFNSSTRFRFKINGQEILPEDAKQNLNRIRVVPNPYVVTALWEPQNPYTSGRGPRQIQFINLPQKCTIRIYAVDGTLVQTLEHDSIMRDGSEPWDMMTMDNMDIAYGIYIYHIDAPGVGEHVGRFLVIK